MTHLQLRHVFAIITLILILLPSKPLMAVDSGYYGYTNDNSDMIINRSMTFDRENSPGLSRMDVDTSDAPAGFGWYLMQASDDVWKICGSDPERRKVFENVNRVDMYHLGHIVGRKVLVPIDMTQAKRYVPNSIRDTVDYKGRMILIDKKTQYFAAYEDGRLIFWGAVSTAEKGHVTSTGTFQILSKEKIHWSGEYQVKMPFSLRYFKGQFLHFGALIGGTSSGGCVHLLYESAIKVFGWLRVGDRVVIV